MRRLEPAVKTVLETQLLRDSFCPGMGQKRIFAVRDHITL